MLYWKYVYHGEKSEFEKKSYFYNMHRPTKEVFLKVQNIVITMRNLSLKKKHVCIIFRLVCVAHPESGLHLLSY